MKREPGSERLWLSVIEKLYSIARTDLDYDRRPVVLVNRADLELVCRIARRGLRGYRP